MSKPDVSTSLHSQLSPRVVRTQELRRPGEGLAGQEARLLEHPGPDALTGFYLTRWRRFGFGLGSFRAALTPEEGCRCRPGPAASTTPGPGTTTSDPPLSSRLRVVPALALRWSWSTQHRAPALSHGAERRTASGEARGRVQWLRADYRAARSRKALRGVDDQQSDIEDATSSGPGRGRAKLFPQLMLIRGALAEADAPFRRPNWRSLQGRNPPGKAMAGLWEFPGGKIEDERSAGGGAGARTPGGAWHRGEAALSRAVHLCFAYIPQLSPLMPLFVCRRWDGTPAPLHHAALKWVRPRDLIAKRDEFPMPEADLPLLPIVARSFVADASGATAIEYALIGTIISIVIVTSVTLIGTNLSSFFTSVATALR